MLSPVLYGLASDIIALRLRWLSPLIMVCRLLGLTIAVALLAHSPVRAQGLFLDTFRDYLESLRVQANIPGLAVAVINQNGVFWESSPFLVETLYGS